MSSKRGGLQEIELNSCQKGSSNKYAQISQSKSRPQLFENSKGKSDLTDPSNLGLQSSGCVNGFRFNSDYKRSKPSGPPISASKFVDENGSPQSASLTLKKAGYSQAQKINTPLKQNYFSPDNAMSGQKLYKEKNAKCGKFNEETKLRGESIRVNGLAMDSIMEDQSMDDNLKLSSYNDNQSKTKLEIERHSSSVSFSTQNLQSTDFKKPLPKIQI